MSSYIPFEIQAEILKRLPVKPLIQSRSVSKLYKRLIDSPDFIISYGVRHPQPDNFILRYEVYPGVDNYLSFVDNVDDGFVQQKFIPIIPNTLSVVGSSHGLLCFKKVIFEYPYSGNDRKEMVTLWNPSIRKSVVIQLPYIYTSPDENVVFRNVIGFGVCPVTSDPTILHIRCNGYKSKTIDMSGTSFPWRVQVFTLSTGTWSVLSTGLPRESIRLRESQPQVVIDRFIYWLAYDKVAVEDGLSQYIFLIMSFDLTAKEFKEINLTGVIGSLSNRLCSIQTISKLRESLVLLEYHREFGEEESVCSLWMMKKQSVNISFTKLYNINVPHASVKTLLGVRKTGELILETKQQNEEHAELEIYDPNSEAIENLGIEGDYYSFFMCSYTETLLLHDHLDGFIYWINN